MYIPTYEEAMAFYNETVDFGGNPWQKNKKLCDLARKFHGNYHWNGSNGFRELVRQEVKFEKKTFFWKKSLHNLGTTHQEIFDFFTDKMNSETEYPFEEIHLRCLVDFWCQEFRRQLKEIGETKLARLFPKDYAMAYYWVIANTVQGILDEAHTFDALTEYFAPYKNWTVEYAPDDDDYNDIDILIKENGVEISRVSVKSEGAFSVDTIEDYRNKRGNRKPNVYCDKNLNRVHFLNLHKVPNKIVVAKHNSNVQAMIDKWGFYAEIQ